MPIDTKNPTVGLLMACALSRGRYYLYNSDPAAPWNRCATMLYAYCILSSSALGRSRQI